VLPRAQICWKIKYLRGGQLPYSYELLQKQLGARIKAMRQERKWTLRDMVVSHGFHLTHWQHFERGTRGISIPSLLRIAEVFGVTPSALLEDLGEVFPKDGEKRAGSSNSPNEPL